MKTVMQHKSDGSLSNFEKGKLFLLALVLVYVPLIMRAYIYDPKLADRPWFAATEFEVDIFLYYKGVALISVSVIMLLLLGFIIYKNREKLRGQFFIYPLLGYAALAIISTLLSPFKQFGFTGIYEQHESLWVLLAYCIVTVYAFFVIENEASVHYIINTLLVLALLTSFIGISQIFGMDFFESAFAKALMIPSSMEEVYGFRENLEFKFSGSGNHQVYLTMYNPNYVGMFSAIVFPIFSSLGFAVRKKSMRIVWASLAIINFIIAMGSGSKTFLGSFLVSGLFALLIYRKNLKKGLKIGLVFLVVLSVLTMGYFFYIKVNPIQYVKNALNTKENANRVGEYQLFSDKVLLSYNGMEMVLSYDETKKENPVKPEIRDRDGNEMKKTQLESGDFKIENELLQDVLVGVYKYEEGSELKFMLLVTLPEGEMRFTKTEKGYIFLTSAFKEDTNVEAPSSVIKNHDAFASGRGYIWSRTFPLLKNTTVTGTGADSFLLAFPQNDYIGKLNGGFRSMVISKPHNIYLQIAVQTGLLSMVCYLVLAFLFIIRGTMFYMKARMDSVSKVFGASLVLGIIGYLVSGIFNDSVVAVAPIYWALLGVGYGVLYLHKKEEISEV